MTYLIANWKSHLNNTQSLVWLSELEKLGNLADSPNLKVVVCLPFTDLPEFNRHLNPSQAALSIGAQTVSSFPAGKHTGDITAEMLSELVTYCLVGHSERRSTFKETSQDVAVQTLALLKQNITPVICLDQPYLDEQIKELFSSNVNLSSCIFAYEPVSAIGSGQPESPERAEKVISKIALLTNQDSPVLYGGSISPQNVLEFTTKPNISGVLVGTGSLDPATFNQLIKLLK
jgi:triosephosphate isomerase (TIM)